MKSRLILLMMILLSASACDIKVKTNFGKQESATTNDDSLISPPMDSIVVAKAWELYATPELAHKRLADETGKWEEQLTYWATKDAKPNVYKLTADISMIMGGKFQTAVHSGDIAGRKFEGISTVAYDNAAKEYVSTWIDNQGTGMMVLKGRYDEATKSVVYTGKVTDPVTGREKDIRQLMIHVDANTIKMESYETGTDGREFKNMEIIMRRKSSNL